VSAVECGASYGLATPSAADMRPRIPPLLATSGPERRTQLLTQLLRQFGGAQGLAACPWLGKVLIDVLSCRPPIIDAEQRQRALDLCTAVQVRRPPDDKTFSWEARRVVFLYVRSLLGRH
jgi:hypothetical protein